MRVSAKRNVKKLFQKMGILIFVFMMMVGSQADFNVLNSNYHNIIFDNDFIIPNSQAPLEDSNLNTGAINVTIQQSYSNATDVSLDQDSVSFTSPAPSSAGYSSSNIDISIKDISIQNKSDIIEDSSRSWRTAMADSSPLVTSFAVPTNCYITNATFDLRLTGSTTNISAVIYNSTWTGSTSKPDGEYDDYIEFGNVTVDGTGWKTAKNETFYLDNSKTDNNTWFIGLYDGLYGATPSFQADWYYNDDSAGDGTDDTISYTWSLTDWSLITDISTVDLLTKIGLSLKNSSPDPTDINLEINGTAVDDTTSNKGEWIDTTAYSGSNGKLNFTASADWYDFSLAIDEVSIEYAKTTFDELTEYSVEFNQLVYWNGSVNITEFDSQFSSNEINFTIPYDWSVSDLLNESSSITYSTTSSQPTKTIRVTGASATNGKWKLLSSSANFGSSVSSYVGGSAVSLANYTNDVSFQHECV